MPTKTPTPPAASPQASPKGARAQLAHLINTGVENIRRLQGWAASLPDRLQKALRPATPSDSPSVYVIPEGPIILALYAGPDTHDALDVAIQAKAPWLSPYVLSVDVLRDPKRHNMLQDGLYAHLLEKARNGDVIAIVGGPNCRTWSILLHKPLPDGTPGHPLRGRDEPHCWGMHDLTREEATKVDDDSILALRMMALYSAARDNGHDPAFALEHPADPAEHSDEPTAHLCCSLWATRAMQDFAAQHDVMLTTFPQGALGGIGGAKWTTLAHRHLPKIRGLQKLQDQATATAPTTARSEELARWAPGLNDAIADSLVQALPSMRH